MLDALKGWTAQQKHAVAASYLGWTLDAMDFFLLVFVFNDIAKEFHTDRSTVTWAVMLTLACRPLGAFIFGRLADNFGRRPILMLNVGVYSLFSVSTAFVQDLTSFFIVRALFGIGMGGVWGIGASLCMESVPVKSRGLVSGLLQSGYCSGYLIASAVFALIYVHVGWRGIFLVGFVPSLALIPYIWLAVKESPVFDRVKARSHSILSVLRSHWKLTLYAVVMMTAFNFFSHGSQDIYPNYLQFREMPPVVTGSIAIIYNIGGILGCWIVAPLSQKFGRRRTMITGALLTIPAIVPWAFSPSVPVLVFGAFLINFLVQGTWSVMPAHLNELSPPGARGTFPGTVYQLGNLFASACINIQLAVAAHFNFAIALASVPLLAALAITLLVWRGPEAHGVEMKN
jgi:SHS family lactate transporter-like MFS transporter